MPIAGQARLRARVEGPPPPPITGWQPGPPALAVTIDHARPRAFEGATTYLGATILLGGEDVTPHLRGGIEVTDGVEEVAVRASFELAGEKWHPHLDSRTFTRTPLEIIFRQGPSQVEMLAETVLRGSVTTSTPSVAGVRIEAADLAYFYGQAETCETIEPLAGLTRDAIAHQVATASGVPSTDIPPGALYTKPVETAGQSLLAWLRAFGEPEGWFWRLGRDGLSLEAYTVQLKTSPRQPDAVWRLDDCAQPAAIQAPAEVPSTWVVRGSSAVTVDEQGLETEIQVTTVEAVYAPVIATKRQLPDGTTQPVGNADSVAEKRLVSRVTTTTTRRGDRPLRQSVFEEAYFNPAFGRLTTVGGVLGGGPEGGFYFLAAWIDEQGRFVTWPKERFVVIGRRDVDYHYDEEGSSSGETRRLYRWHRRREAVRLASSVDEDGAPVISHAGPVVGSDGVSYVGPGPLDRFGLAEEQRLEVLYGTAGAQVGDRLRTFAYGSPRTSVDPLSAYWVNSDGTGMLSVREEWQEVEDAVRRQTLDADQRVTAETTTVLARTPTPSVHGEFDFGDYRSAQQVEPWGVKEVRSVAYVVLSADQYQVIESTDGHAGAPITHTGRPPVPLWRRSVWTLLVQHPIELLLDDDTLREWFGHRTRVIDSEFVQSAEEGRRVLEQAMRRELSYELNVVRPETYARPGDTVLILDRRQRLFRRALVWGRRRSRSLWPPRADAEYQLLVPLDFHVDAAAELPREAA